MSKISHAAKSALLIAFMKALACFISSQMNAWIVVHVSLSAQWIAIYYEDDVPGQWQDYKKINTEFFVELGSPGGASKVGQTNSDHADVSALGPQTS